MYITVGTLRFEGMIKFNVCCVHICGAGGSAVGRLTALQARKSWVRFFAGVLLVFFTDLIIPADLRVLGVDSASKTKECREYFVGVTSAGFRLTALSISSADYLESWESHPPGTPSACPDL
jgi:hypothetical protein